MDVTSHEKIFLNQALEVNAYDRVIRDNEDKVILLLCNIYSLFQLIAADKEVSALEEARDRLFHSLGFIDAQQKGVEMF